MNTAPQLIIFDCDGTLVDSEMIYNAVVSEILSERGYHHYSPEDCYKRFTGLTLSAMRVKLEEEEGADMSFLTRDLYIDRAQIKMEQKIEAIAGAPDLVKRAAGRFKICVASNGERSSVIKSLKLTGLYDFFGDERIFTRIQVKHGKPAPDLFYFAAKNMGITPAECLVIEDSVPGVQGGVAAGMMVYGFTGSHHEPETHAQSLKNAGASKVYNSLIHITEALEI